MIIRKTMLVLSAAVIVILCSTCTPPVKTNPKDETGPATVTEAAQLALENLPTLKTTLPKSLQAETAAKAMSRALGDTTVLTPDNLPGLKSQAWYELQQPDTGFVHFINNVFKKIKSYAQENNVTVGEVFEIPVTAADIETAFGYTIGVTYDVTWKFLIDGDTVSDFTIYSQVTANVPYGDMTVNVNATTRFDISYADGSEDRTMDMYFNIYVDMTDGESHYEIIEPVYARYDTATGECIAVFQAQQDGQTMSGVQSTKVGTDGRITTTSLQLNNGVPEYIHIAYGDDTAGGIASMSSWEGSSSAYYWGEYYDSNGELIKRMNGDTKLWIPNESEMDSYVNLTDLGFSSAPTTISVRSSGDYVDGTWYYNREIQNGSGSWIAVSRESWSYSGGQSICLFEVVDGTGGWVPVYRRTYTETGCYNEIYYDGGWKSTLDWYCYGWNFMFKSSPTGWTTGDVIYYCNGSRSDGDYWVNDFYQGFVVPAAVSRFGKNYYITTEYPLKRVLPLAGTYATDFNLVQEEGETYEWSWNDIDGTVRNDSWTAYTYYLNKKVRPDPDVPGTSLPAEDPVRFESQYDIALDKVSSYDMYYWSGTSYYKVKSCFVTTTGALPAYFTEPNETLVNSVDANLQSAMNAAYTLGVSDYLDELEIAQDPAPGIFDE